MIVRTWRAANAHPDLDQVVVATDHPEIADAIHQAGGNAVLTGEHPSGTDRCHAAWKALDQPDVAILNLQGDEPFVDEAHITAVCNGLREKQGQVVTAMRPASAEEPHRPERVKAISDPSGRALYFSRSPVPFGGPWFIHIGLYGFQPGALQQCATLPESPLEQSEKLEQLRWLEAGIHLHVVHVKETNGPGSIDTEEDLEKVRQWWQNQNPPAQ